MIRDHPVLIRRAAATEAELLSSIARRSKAHWGYSADLIDAWQAELTLCAADLRTMLIHLAIVDNEIAGFYALAPSVDRSWSLEHLWVLPDLMHRGIGKTLLMHALSTAFSAGAESIAVDADPNAETFYVRGGAVRIDTIPAPIADDPGRVRPQLVFSRQACRRS